MENDSQITIDATEAQPPSGVGLGAPQWCGDSGWVENLTEEIPPQLSKLEMDHIALLSDRNHLHAAATCVEYVLRRVSAFGDDLGPNVTKAEVGTALQSLRAALNATPETQAQPQASRLAGVSGSAWAGMWYSKNKLDGVTRHLLYHNGVIALFSTRTKAREFIERRYGYIRTRDDLKAEPHGWHVPTAVRVSITPNDQSEGSAPRRAPETERTIE
jgi:hypothetical protein